MRGWAGKAEALTALFLSGSAAKSAEKQGRVIVQVCIYRRIKISRLKMPLIAQKTASIARIDLEYFPGFSL
jgi:hypothetical protein